MTPAAVAAGFMVVAAALVVTRAPAPAPAAHEPVLARSSSDAAALRRVASQTAQSGPFAAGPQTFVANGRLIRDARLDQYLAAHQQFSGSSALGAPSGFLRSATAEAPAR